MSQVDHRGCLLLAQAVLIPIQVLPVWLAVHPNLVIQKLVRMLNNLKLRIRKRENYAVKNWVHLEKINSMMMMMMMKRFRPSRKHGFLFWLVFNTPREKVPRIFSRLSRIFEFEKDRVLFKIWEIEFSRFNFTMYFRSTGNFKFLCCKLITSRFHLNFEIRMLLTDILESLFFS